MERIFNRVFVTGGGGYCASLLIPQLVSRGYEVTAFDPFWFGDYLPQHPNLKRITGDIRDAAQLREVVPGHDAFVSLGCVSNDASFELDEQLSTSINLDAFEPMVLAAKGAGVKRFIYASSSSVYGVSDQPDVTEDHPLVPVSLYNEYKGKCEPLLNKHADDSFTTVTFRPATVCGYAPRLRLDLSVNILTNHAVTNNKITVFGGSQLRPNLHVQDYCDAVEMFLTAPTEKIQKEIFNIGFQNMSIMDIAKMVKKVVAEEYPQKPEIDIVTTTSDDIRSYHINSDKVKRVLGFAPRYTIEDAVRSLCEAFKAGKIPDSMTDDRYFNIRTVKKLNLK